MSSALAALAHPSPPDRIGHVVGSPAGRTSGDVLPPLLEDRIRYNAAVFDSQFFEESWPTISRGLESEVDAESEVGWILGHVAPAAADGSWTRRCASPVTHSP